MDGYEGYATDNAISGLEAQAINGAAIVIERGPDLVLLFSGRSSSLS